jgi:two-component system OmpR family sensor kinase
MKTPWRTLRGRIALGSLAGLLIASIAFAALGTELIRSQTVSDETATLASQAKGMAKLMSEEAQRQIESGAGGYSPSAARIAALEALVGKGTSLVYQGGNLAPGTPPTASTGTPTPLERVVVDQLDQDRLAADGIQQFNTTIPGTGVKAIAAAAPITFSGEVVGAAVLLREQSELVSIWRRFAERLLIAAAIGLGVAFLVSLLLTRRALAPLKRLELAAISVGRGDLETRVPAAGTEEFDALATAFNTMVRELQHRDALTRDFLMRVTHDLRTPLTAIRGHAQALNDGIVPDENVPRSLGAIEDEAERLESLITDLLDLAKLEARRFRLDLGTVDGNDIVDRAFTAYAGEAARRGVRYERDFEELPELYTDGTRVRQIVGNLIDNAFRWTPDGGTVHVAATQRPGGGAVIAVTDNGPGIPPEKLAEIFEPFRSQNTPDGQHGSGLGLAISRQLARALGGDLRVESQIGRGSRFTLELPGEARQPTLTR